MANLCIFFPDVSFLAHKEPFTCDGARELCFVGLVLPLAACFSGELYPDTTFARWGSCCQSLQMQSHVNARAITRGEPTGKDRIFVSSYGTNLQLFGRDAGQYTGQASGGPCWTLGFPQGGALRHG